MLLLSTFMLDPPRPRSKLGRTLRRALFAGAAFAAGCLSALPPKPVEVAGEPAPALPSRLTADNRGTVVIVALDGVRAQDVFQGVDAKLAQALRVPPSEVVPADELMPSLHHILATRGSAIGVPGYGQEMLVSGPNYVSLPGYLEMLSGKPSRCQSNDCPPTTDETLLDEVAELGGGWAGDVALIASWPGLAKAAARDPSRVVVSAGRTRGATRHFLRYDRKASELLDAGAKAPSYPGHGDFRPDRLTAAIALRYLRTQRPHLLFVGLGEPDAYAHRGLYREYLASLRQADAVIGEIDHLLGELAAGGHPTTLFVTTDHGRGARFASHGAGSPESARVWLVAAGAGIAARGLVHTPTERRLADLAPTLRHLLGVPPDETAGAGSVLEELLASGSSPYARLARGRLEPRARDTGL
jgi:hypothetical protein